ncbi:CRISPR/Cas system CSM-associated protein Csm2 small subunit [Enterococcus sp. PF1-24]|uniref:hypothetical protein n=1 Tax=unclassified Enterococcus TaxID=2608891 RepID=UPI002476F7E7|nr:MULTISPECIES: hypothetical protein [unclassified Enterococcus]MDH6364700.1 CRISPR/Cas system CSM-associated protein Csm2 small subunit [Enterococcus sp. PFB1-1]MDH6401824.1 CRISPR/Cas system CSM-associated protein Csm2 small subunit [Enterococcus sp. PF1-24]
MNDLKTNETNLFENTKHFVKQANNSLLEREQLLDSLEIAIDKFEDIYFDDDQTRREFAKAKNLLTVLFYSYKDLYAIDEDLVRSFESCNLFGKKCDV